VVRQAGRRILDELKNPAFLKFLWERAGTKLPEDQRTVSGDFRTLPYRINKDIFVNVIELPPPVNPPEALYAGVVVRIRHPADTSGDESRYFTLELGVDITDASPSMTFFCESTENEHKNFGERSIRSAEEFARAIAEVVDP